MADIDIFLSSGLDDFNRFEWPTRFVRCPDVGEIIQSRPYAKSNGVRVVELRVVTVVHCYDGSVCLDLHLKSGYTMEWWESMKPWK